jgi:hypothetical protein
MVELEMLMTNEANWTVVLNGLWDIRWSGAAL